MDILKIKTKVEFKIDEGEIVHEKN